MNILDSSKQILHAFPKRLCATFASMIVWNESYLSQGCLRCPFDMPREHSFFQFRLDLHLACYSCNDCLFLVDCFGCRLVLPGFGAGADHLMSTRECQLIALAPACIYNALLPHTEQIIGRVLLRSSNDDVDLHFMFCRLPHKA